MALQRRAHRKTLQTPETPKTKKFSKFLRTLNAWGFANIKDPDIWFENSKSTHFKVSKTKSDGRIH